MNVYVTFDGGRFGCDSINRCLYIWYNFNNNTAVRGARGTSQGRNPYGEPCLKFSITILIFFAIYQPAETNILIWVNIFKCHTY